LEYDGSSETIRCEYCGSTIIVPESLKTGHSQAGYLGQQQPEQSGKIHQILEYVQAGNRIQAIKLYHETFGGSLQDAKKAVDVLADGQPMVVTYSAANATSKGCSCLVYLGILVTMLMAGGFAFLQTTDTSISTVISDITNGEIPSITNIEELEAIVSTVGSSAAISNFTPFGDALPTTSGGDGLGADLLVESRVYQGGIVKIMLSYTEESSRQRGERWQLQIGDTNNYINISYTFDNQHVYVVSGTAVHAYTRATGEEVWQANLSDVVTRNCIGCLRAASGVLVAQTADGQLYGLSADTGQQLWRVRLEDDVRSFYDNGQQAFAILDGKIAILDEIDSLESAIMLYDLQSGELVHQIYPTCTDMENFFDPDTLQDSGMIFVHEATNQLIVLFGTTFVRQPCLQKFNPSTGELLWEQRLPVDRTLMFGARAGFITENSLSPFFVVNSDSLLVTLDGEENNGVMQFSSESGEILFYHEDPDYDLAPIGAQNGRILTWGVRKRGTEQVEVWGIDSATNTPAWQHTLQAQYLFELQPFDDQWAYRLTPSGLVVLQLLATPEPAELLAQNLDVADGRLLYETTSTTSSDNWDGLAWTPNHGYLTLDAIYQLNLATGEAARQWP
jgi:outer membrane protein assembly factor BamB